MTSQEEAKALGYCLAAIVESLNSLGFLNPQYTGFKNSDTGGQIILADSPDGKVSFAIEVKTWDKPKGTVNDRTRNFTGGVQQR